MMCHPQSTNMKRMSLGCDFRAYAQFEYGKQCIFK